MTTTRAARVFAVVVFFVLFAGEAVRNTLSWYGFAAVAVVLLALSSVIVVRHRPELRALRRPAPALLAAFLVWAALSAAWSAYPAATALGIAAVLAPTVAVIAVSRLLPPDALLGALGWALGAILGLSFVFEAAVATIVGGPVLPVFPIDVEPGERIPDAFYWSRGLLWEGGRIQGVVGNSNLLGFIALLALIVGAALLVTRRGGPRRVAAPTVLVAAAILGLLTTRSATVIVATVAVAVVVASALLIRRARRRGISRSVLAALGLVVVALLAAATWAAAPLLTRLLGRSSDLTGRLDIWEAVWTLVQQRPAVGWGWTGYWQPWVPLYADLAPRRGVVYLQAHNAFLDALLQLGVVGLILLVLAIAATVARQRRSLLGLALLAALLAQSLAESRLLYEGNWALLVLLAAGAVGTTASSTASPGAGTRDDRAGQAVLTRGRRPLRRRAP